MRACPIAPATALSGARTRSPVIGSPEPMSEEPSDTAQILALLQKQAEQSRYLAQLRVQRAWEQEIAKPRHADPKRLVRHGYKGYSQNDDAGITAEIFRRIGTVGRTC